MFKPIRRKRLYVEVLEQIQQLLAEGTLKPGDRLTSERELANRLGVSRSSIREALSALDLMGILESRPGEGTFVRAEPAEEVYKPLALMLLLEKKNNYDVLEIRKILEAESAFLAAERAKKENLEKMEKCLFEMEKDIELGTVREEPNAMFHLFVAESTQNKVMEKLMHAVIDLVVFSMKASREKMLRKPGNREKLYTQHQEIYRAIAARDPVAARNKMCEHLTFITYETFYFEREGRV